MEEGTQIPECQIVDLPVELLDGILCLVSLEEPMPLVLPLVCKTWRARKSVWSPPPSPASSLHQKITKAKQLMSATARAGNLSLMKWMRENGCSWDEDSPMMAAKGGHLEIFQWLLEQQCPVDRRACSAAAGGGFLEVLKWMREQRGGGGKARINHLFPWNATPCKEAAAGGHLEVLKWLRESAKCKLKFAPCLNAAASGGHVEVMKWLIEKQTVNRWWDQKLVGGLAAKAGQLEVLKWLKETKKRSIDNATVKYAAEGGHLEVLKWLKEENDASFTESTFSAAARGGNIEMLIWLKEQGCAWEKSIYTAAALGGRKEVLQWLVENGFTSWDEPDLRQIVFNCAPKQNFEVLKWMMTKWELTKGQQDHPLHHSVLEAAVAAGYHDVMKWALENGCQMS